MGEGREAYARGAAVTGHFRVYAAPPSGSRWRPSSQVGDLIRDAHRAVPGASATVAAALLASSVAAAYAAPLTGVLLAERRVPVPDPGQVWLRSYVTGVDAVAVGRTSMTVLPGDPLAGQPYVTVAADLDALRRAALDGYRAMVVPLLDHVAATTRRGRRALWADAGDRLATYLLLAGRARTEQRRGRDEADALLALADPPLRHDPAWLEFDHRGERVIWKRRPVCCLVYQAPTFRGQFCATCPKLPVAETVARTRDWLG